MSEASIREAFALTREGRFAESRSLCARLLRDAPNDPELHQMAAAAAIGLGRSAAAVHHLKKAAALAPEDARFHVALAELYFGMNRLDGALEQATAALRLAPGETRSIAAYARCCLAAGRYEAAIEILKDDSEPASRALLTRACALQGRDLVARRLYLDGADAYEKSLALDQAQPAVLSNLGSAYAFAGNHAAAESCFRRAIACDGGFLAARSNLLLLMHYSGRYGPAEIAREHRTQGRAWSLPARPDAPPAIRRTRKRLRIGYVSSDLRRHPVATFLEPILTHHDRKNFEVFCYASASSGDAVTKRLRGLADGWRSIFGLSDEQAAKQVRQDACDILIDLGGHTHGNRLGLFALRPAPVQATYLGYPDTTGLACMQYRITDSNCDPKRGSASLSTEKLQRTGECFVCYRPPADAPMVKRLPCDAAGAFTFGSLNQYFKISEQTAELWAAILRAVPGARLLLGALSFDDPRIAEAARQRFATLGVEPARIALRGYLASQRLHLATYNEIDVALDPFPFNGSTTTCEALWMGAPVISLRGRSSASRMGVAILKAAGLVEWVAKSPEEYVQKAVRAERDRDALREMRAGLRGRMARSPLCDQAGFTRRFEAVLREMWGEQHASGQDAARRGTNPKNACRRIG